MAQNASIHALCNRRNVIKKFIKTPVLGIIKSVDFVQFEERYSGREEREKGLGKLDIPPNGQVWRGLKSSKKLYFLGMSGQVWFLRDVFADL
jgi:hypothetical protein